MQLPIAAYFVKMRLEQAATNAKSKKFFSLIHDQSKTEAIPIVKPENQRFSSAVSLSMRR